MDTPIITFASLNTMPMDIAAIRMNNQLMTFARKILHSIEFLNEGIPTYMFIMTRKELRCHMKRNGYKKYEITEELFPKKKKRGSMRRARIERKWGKFNDPPLPDGVYIDEWVDPPMTPPISREEFMQKSSFSAPWPGPFEGEEEL